MSLTRRQFLIGSAAAGTGLFLVSFAGGTRIVRAVPIPGASLDPGDIGKFMSPLLIPPVMPRAGVIKPKGGKPIDYYEISMRQFAQQILPAGLPATHGLGVRRGRAVTANADCCSTTPRRSRSRPVEAAGPGQVDQRPGRRERELPAASAAGRPDAPLGEPARGVTGRDSGRRFDETPGRYTGPVPMVTHVHGAVGVGDESDGYAEAWYLPAANNIPTGYATEGTWYDFFAGKAQAGYGATWGPGFATFQYPNGQRASTIWYHDHTLGMTRLNVYAGPGGLLPGPRRTRATSRPRQPHRHRGHPARPGAEGNGQVPAEQDLLRDPDRDPGPVVQRRRFAVLPGHPRRSSTASPARTSRTATELLADLEPGVLRQHDHGQRQHVALPGRRAAALPAPLPQRLPVALPDPRLRQRSRASRSGRSATKAASWLPRSTCRRTTTTGS